MLKKYAENRLSIHYLKSIARKIKGSFPARWLRTFYEISTGSPNVQITHAQKTKSAPSLEEAIKIFSNRWPEVKSSSESEPIFIFSAGWRSGSTLLQRLLSSSGQTIIWGEPFGHSGLIDYVSSPIKAITNKYPRSDSFIHVFHQDGNSLPNLAELWIANLNPNMNYLLESQINFFINLFEKPAKEYGALRWGIKEVRLTIDHAIYLNWLFPKAKFIFLYRNPYDAYASYQEFGKYNVWPYDYWYNVWPIDSIDTPGRFGKHWNDLLKGYLTGSEKVNSITIKYEELSQGDIEFELLEEFLHIHVNKEVMKKKVKGTNIKKHNISLNQLQELSSVVEPLASKLGYKQPQL